MMHSIVDLAMTLSRLPGVGNKSAKRIAYYLLEEPSLRQLLAEQLESLASSVYLCPICKAYTQESSTCQYCDQHRQTAHVLCVVERASDVINIEEAAMFTGRYHVLGGVLSPMAGVGPQQLHLANLLQRIQEQEISEVIIATSFTLEGEATAHYLEGQLAHLGIPITRLASGLSAGSQLEFADKQSLRKSFLSRHPMQE
jgi:recombination protein RecR